MDFIAECSSNWILQDGTRSLERARELIRSAAASGATAVKFQLFKGDLLNRDPEVVNRLKQMELPETWLPDLKSVAEECMVEFLVTPFYLEAVDYLEQLEIQRYKIASWDITYFPLLKKVAETKKPVILSTGASTNEEVLEALDILRPDGCWEDITLLHCTGGYPTPVADLNMGRMTELWALSWQKNNKSDTYNDLKVGLSSHVPDPYITASSVMYGGEVIEAHFDLEDKKGAESGHSLTPAEFETMVLYANLFAEAKSRREFGFSDVDERARKNARRDPVDWLRPTLT